MAAQAEGSHRSQVYALSAGPDRAIWIPEYMPRRTRSTGAFRSNTDSAETILRQVESRRQKFISHFGQNSWRQARRAAWGSALESIWIGIHNCIFQQEQPLVRNEFGPARAANAIRCSRSKFNFNQKRDLDS